MEMVDKATEKRWKRKMGRLLWTRRLYSPWFLLVYYWFWRTLFRFCWLGGVRRRTPVLTGCIFLFFLYFHSFLEFSSFLFTYAINSFSSSPSCSSFLLTQPNTTSFSFPSSRIPSVPL